MLVLQEEEKQNKELLAWYKELIALRKKSPSLYEGDYVAVLCDDEHNVYGFRRETEEESCIVLVNAGAADYDARVEAQGTWTNVFGQSYVTKDADMLCAKLPAYSVDILKKQKGSTK